MKKLFTIEQVVNLTNFHYQTIWKWIKEGKLKAIQPSGKKKGKWLVKEEDLERFLDD